MEEKQPIETRQVKMLMVNPTDFMVLFTKGLRVKSGYKLIKGLPSDATLLTIAYEPARNAILMVVESKEYTAIPKTQLPPIEAVEIEINDKRFSKPKK